MEKVEIDIEFAWRLVLVLKDADERLNEVGTNEIIECIERLREALPEVT